MRSGDAQAAALQGRLQALEGLGAPVHRPVDWYLVQHLVRRAAEQEIPVASILWLVAHSRVEDLELAMASHQTAEPAAAPSVTDQRPLAQLLRDWPRRAAGPSPMEGFRDVWLKMDAHVRLDQALAQAPVNAGPLNTQRVVLSALETLRQLSPDYLARFMAQLGTLAWLEAEAGGVVNPARSATKAARRNPSKAPRRTTTDNV